MMRNLSDAAFLLTLLVSGFLVSSCSKGQVGSVAEAAPEQPAERADAVRAPDNRALDGQKSSLVGVGASGSFEDGSARLTTEGAPKALELTTQPCDIGRLYSPPGTVLMDFRPLADGLHQSKLAGKTEQEGEKASPLSEEDRQWLFASVPWSDSEDGNKVRSEEEVVLSSVLLTAGPRVSFTGRAEKEILAVVRHWKGFPDQDPDDTLTTYDWDYQYRTVVVALQPVRSVLAVDPGGRHTMEALLVKDVDGDGLDDALMGFDYFKGGEDDNYAWLLLLRGGRVRRLSFGNVYHSDCSRNGHEGVTAAVLYLTQSIPRELTKVVFQRACHGGPWLRQSEDSWWAQVPPDSGRVTFVTESD